MNKLKNILWSLAIAICIVSCSDDSSDPNPKTDPDPNSDYKAPTYGDDYSSIADWNERGNWNLANVHDPTVEKCGDYYYMYSTDASYGNAHAGHGHFLARRSKDLVKWEFIGMAMSQEPAWVLDSINNMRDRLGLMRITKPQYGFWAPAVRKVGNKYRMYYSVILDNYIQTGNPTYEPFDGSWTEKAFIGMMETSDLSSNQWVDKGMVIHSVSDRGNNWSRQSTSDWNAYFKWNAIDPSLIVAEDGKNWLVYGSWHSGIVAVELDPITGKPYKLESIEDYGTRIARRQNSDYNRWQGQEAPEIIYNAETGYYYLFLAYDELSVAYNTRVCRSQNIEGPYYGIDGQNISQGADCWPVITHPYKFSNHSGWVGISHCCVFQDPETKEWYYSSQGRLPANTNGNAYSNAIMMGHVRSIEWTEDGWPVVMPERYAAVPQKEIAEDDLTGTWEFITLKYQYAVLQASTVINLSADKKVTGALSGSWSYDASKGILNIGSEKVIVQNGLDWESDPRTTTIIFAGISGNYSIWGKKVY